MLYLSTNCPKLFRKVLKRLKNLGKKSTCLDSNSQLANSCSYLAVTQPDVFIETVYEEQQTKQAVRRKKIGDQMAVDLEEVFTHYFGDVPAFVWSICNAQQDDDHILAGRQKVYKRLRELKHTKHFLTRMIHFYETQQDESMQTDGLEHFMDVYFSSLYDLVLSCIRTIELEYPELGVIGKRPSSFHTSSTTHLSKRISLPVCMKEDQNLEEQYQKLLRMPCPYEPILSAAPEQKNGVQRRRRNNHKQDYFYC